MKNYRWLYKKASPNQKLITDTAKRIPTVKGFGTDISSPGATFEQIAVDIPQVPNTIVEKFTKNNPRIKSDYRVDPKDYRVTYDLGPASNYTLSRIHSYNTALSPEENDRRYRKRHASRSGYRMLDVHRVARSGMPDIYDYVDPRMPPLISLFEHRHLNRMPKVNPDRHAYITTVKGFPSAYVGGIALQDDNGGFVAMSQENSPYHIGFHEAAKHFGSFPLWEGPDTEEAWKEAVHDIEEITGQKNLLSRYGFSSWAEFNRMLTGVQDRSMALNPNGDGFHTTYRTLIPMLPALEKDFLAQDGPNADISALRPILEDLANYEDAKKAGKCKEDPAREQLILFLNGYLLRADNSQQQKQLFSPGTEGLREYAIG